MSRRRMFLIILTLTITTGALADTSSAPSASARDDEPVVVATGGTKGVYYEYGRAFAEASAKRLGGVRLLTTLGSVENIKMLVDGRASFAFSAADAASDAYNGKPPFATPVPVRAVARLYDDYIHVVVPAASPVHSLAGLRGLRVSPGPDGSGTELIANRLLSLAGIDPRRDIRRRPLSINDSVTALEAGQIDAFFWSGGLSTAGIEELARAMPIRLVWLADAAAELRARYGTAYRVGSIPAGCYPGVTEAVTTVAVPNLLVTLASTPPDLVRRVTAALFATAAGTTGGPPAIGELDARVAILTGAIPIHDGAADYYRSTKIGE